VTASAFAVAFFWKFFSLTSPDDALWMLASVIAWHVKTMCEGDAFAIVG
jgi:hypothetical protein